MIRSAPIAPAIALAAALAALAPGGAARAAQLSFDGDWAEQGLLRLRTNEYAPRGDSLGVVSEGTVSILYRRLGAAMGGARMAAWDWEVTESVPPTDLRVKGGDDRNLAIYFVLATPEAADALRDAPLRRLMGAEGVRLLIYTWGGPEDARGTSFPSPYFDGKGQTVVMEPAGTGRASARVDLRADLDRAFEGAFPVLLGVAVSADADDTDSRVEAVISNLTLE
ncbi:DUF3047 domain-containing protein [Palleronia sediminis]|uniref:DUF3047 domain-containing protein n=1 Tax=Palleronia sediminis TaxID=2547833 RepID=A0A4R6ANM2_9RHOB|nr:DUF3047 domain-containing protein [Palleronia sediminis]TDL84178.1 DUF3047 domain-containing protein [Palleronia sediminis]